MAEGWFDRENPGRMPGVELTEDEESWVVEVIERRARGERGVIELPALDGEDGNA